MGMPFSSVNTQVAVVANAVQFPNGDILNLSAAWWVKRIQKRVEVRYTDSSVSSYDYQDEPSADSAYQNIRAAMNVIALGGPNITSITPNSALAGSTVNAVVKGLNFKSTGSLKISTDAATLTFVDSFTLLISVLGTQPAGFYNVVYTDPDGVTTATLTSGFHWT